MTKKKATRKKSTPTSLNGEAQYSFSLKFSGAKEVRVGSVIARESHDGDPDQSGISICDETLIIYTGPSAPQLASFHFERRQWQETPRGSFNMQTRSYQFFIPVPIEGSRLPSPFDSTLLVAIDRHGSLAVVTVAPVNPPRPEVRSK